MQIKAKIDFKELQESSNVCELLDKESCKAIGQLALSDYNADKQSRTQWEERYKQAMELAMQVIKNKTFPWPNASNVKFPLLTIAALNFHAKAYPALISGDNLVKQRVIGPDPEGKKLDRANRVGPHMSYQLLEESNWESEMDRGLLVLAIMGTIFKKTLQNGKRIYSDLVLPQDLVINYYATDINDCRASHCFQLWPNEVKTKIIDGIYQEPVEDSIAAMLALKKPEAGSNTTAVVRSAVADKPVGPVEEVRNKTQAMEPPMDGGKPLNFVEQTTWLDLDGDGYAEPYYVTFHLESGYVFRILARWLPSGVRKIGKTIAEITPEQVYTKYELIPAADGGFYGMGLGQLLAPLNKSVDTLINQLLDSGTMHTLGGGFLGRGARLKYGQTIMRPFEWVNVDSTGPSIRDNILPLPTREPSAVLYQLLTYLVGYGERVGSSGDLQMGQLPEAGNIKAKAAEIANENGRIIFEATYKRIWRAMKGEFKRVYRLNALSIGTPMGDPDVEKLFGVTPEDYSENDKGICPAADPNVVSNTARKERAQLVFQTAQAVPGHDTYEVTKNLYEAYQVDGIDRFLPPPGSERAKALEPGPSIEMLQLQIDGKVAEARMAEMQARQMKVIGELQIAAQKMGAEIMELQAKAMKAMAEAQGVKEDNTTNLINAQLQAAKQKQDSLFKTIDVLMELRANGLETSNSRGSSKGTPDAGGGQLAGMDGSAINAAILPGATMGAEDVAMQ